MPRLSARVHRLDPGQIIIERTPGVTVVVPAAEAADFHAQLGQVLAESTLRRVQDRQDTKEASL